jgi:hypothetical protein
MVSLGGVDRRAQILLHSGFQARHVTCSKSPA